MKASDKRAMPLYGPDAPSWWQGKLVRATVGRMALWLFRTKFVDTHHVPASGGMVYAGNHVSYLDPVLLWSGAPRLAHFMAKVELWNNRLLGYALDNFWVFPVDRGAADREAIKRATRLLEAGEAVGMFPEGTRRREGDEQMGEAHSGVAFIAMRAGVPVVPVGIVGTDKAWPPGAKLPRLVRVTIRFGEPVDPADFEGSRREIVDAMTAEIMRRINELRSTAKGE